VGSARLFDVSYDHPVLTLSAVVLSPEEYSNVLLVKHLRLDSVGQFRWTTNELLKLGVPFAEVGEALSILRQSRPVFRYRTWDWADLGGQVVCEWLGVET
jgi:hypothetical protein